MNSQPGSEAEEVVYMETIRYGAWSPLLMLVLFGILIATAVIALFDRNRRLFFEVTKSYVRFGFGLVKKEFRRPDITSCEPYELTFQNYLGYGIRIGRDGTVACNTRNGKGVKMVVEGQKRPYVVSVDDPERVCELLQ